MLLTHPIPSSALVVLSAVIVHAAATPFARSDSEVTFSASSSTPATFLGCFDPSTVSGGSKAGSLSACLDGCSSSGGYAYFLPSSGECACAVSPLWADYTTTTNSSCPSTSAIGAILGSNYTLSACTSSLPSDDTAVAIGFPPANCLSICGSRSSGYAAMAQIPSEGGWECWCTSDLSLVSTSSSSSCDGNSLWVYANPAVQKTIGSNAAVVLWNAWTSNGANQYATSERDTNTGTNVYKRGLPQ